jgi:heptosyltransferase-3
VKKILIIIVSRIGDTLFATPSIHAISQFYNDSKITVLAHPKRHQVLQRLSFINHVGKISKNSAVWRGYFSTQYDFAFVYGFDEKLIKYALRVANKVIAFKQKHNSINNKLYKAVDFPKFQSMHAVDQLLELPKSVNITAKSKRLSFALSIEEELFAERLLSKHGVNDKLLVGLQVASFPTKSYRDWPIENFLEMCNEILKRYSHAHFVIFGGNMEKDKTHWIFEQLNNHATLLAGKLSLRETGSVMSKMDLYVGVDTGPSHIMSAFDIPMVVLFHCLSSNLHTGAIEHPCYFPVNHESEECNEYSSMKDIPVSTVITSVIKALDGC